MLNFVTPTLFVTEGVRADTNPAVTELLGCEDDGPALLPGNPTERGGGEGGGGAGHKSNKILLFSCIWKWL